MTPLSRRLPVDTHLWGTDGGAVVSTCMQGYTHDDIAHENTLMKAPW